MEPRLCSSSLHRGRVIIIIINTRPKPAYGWQVVAGSWSQDTDEVSTFLVFLTSHFAPAALSSDLTNLGPLTMESDQKPWNHLEKPWKPTKNHEKPWNQLEKPWKPTKNREKPWNHLETNLNPWKPIKTDMEPWKTNLEPSKLTQSCTGWLGGVQVVTGHSQGEVMIFCYRHSS